MTATPPAIESLLIVNADVWSLDDTPVAGEAITIRDGRIAAVGSRQHCESETGPATSVIDAGGHSVIPGLVDGHAHMDREGLKGEIPSLAGCRSISDVKEKIRALVQKAEPGEWIVTMPLGAPPDFSGMPDALGEGRWPTRHDLDEVAPDNPVYIRAIWGYWRHTLPLVSIANSRALEIAGIDRNTPAPFPGIEIEHDSASGKPTGVFIENNYMPLVEFTLMKCAPRFSAAQRLAGLSRSMAIYNGFGTTAVYEGHGVADEVLAAYQGLRETGPLPVRSHLTLSPRWGGATADTVRECLGEWMSWLRRRGLGDDYLRVQGLYTEPGITAENSLRATEGGSYTGWAGFYYDAGLPPEALGVLMEESAMAGIRVSGIGLGMLDGYVKAHRRASIAEARWVVEHISWVSPEEIDIARDLGVVMTTHTNRYLWKEGPMLLAQSPDRDPNELVPLRRLRDAGVPVCLATDNVPPSLFHPISQAVNRLGRNGSPVAPEQALSLEEALQSSCRNGAYLCFAEDRRGMLRPGMDADVVILDRSIRKDDVSDIASTTAETTIVGGKIVHNANTGPEPSSA